MEANFYEGYFSDGMWFGFSEVGSVGGKLVRIFHYRISHTLAGSSIIELLCLHANIFRDKIQ